MRWWHTVSAPDLGSTVVTIPDSAASAMLLSSGCEEPSFSASNSAFSVFSAFFSPFSASNSDPPPPPELVVGFLIAAPSLTASTASEDAPPASPTASCYKMLPPLPRPLLLVAEWMSGTVNSLSSSLRLLSSSELSWCSRSLDSSPATPPPPTDDVETME